MDHYSILDRTPLPPPVVGSISAQIAESNRQLPPLSEPEPRFFAEDSGRSLAEMAERDLDAALQLLADRAQYITGASGAAIALRRGEHHDMLCRASSGSNAPELGALLSMDYGLSGECVRTRQLLRCDDAEHDPRVNHEVCRELGIASVVVMPILSGQQILGVFELLSGKPRAFEERDLSALKRLSEMVETAVTHAFAAQTYPIANPSVPEIQSEPANQHAFVQSDSSIATNLPSPAQATAEPAPAKPEEAVPAKPMFWSAAMRTQIAPQPQASAEAVSVPPVLRNLHKCQACGFPVSQGRAFCVECEERQWRGQRLAHPAVSAPKEAVAPAPADSKNFTGLADALRSLKQDSSEPKGLAKIAAAPKALESKALEVNRPEPKTPEANSVETKSLELKTAEPAPKLPAATPPTQAPTASVPPQHDSIVLAAEPAVFGEEVSVDENSAPFLSSTLPSESWLSSNKYILATLLLVAIVIAAVGLLH
jgi:hypothetical protein